MKRKIWSVVITLAFLTGAAALAQNADQNTGGPTKNTLGMKVTQPSEGATITGSTVRVTVDYNKGIFGAGQGTHFGEANFPQPRFDVYLDNELKTTLKGTESNVATIHDVAPGDHKVAVVALNVSGEVIDRREFNIRTVPSPAAAEATRHETVTAESAPAPRTYESAPPPAPPVAEEKALPKTASASPRLALAGLVLVAGGLLLARKAR